MHIGARRAQHLNHFHMARRDGEHQRRLALLVALLQIGAGLQQRLHAIERAGGRRLRRVNSPAASRCS